MNRWLRLRASEWIFIGFFGYLGALSHWFPDRPNLQHQPAAFLILIFLVFVALAGLEQTRISRGISMARDFLPIVITLLAFRQMEYFLPPHFDHRLENVWIQWDRTLLESWHLKAAIEKFGAILPLYLELCYLAVYGLPFYCIAILYAENKRAAVDRFLVIYLTGTLVAYSLFPFFPSQPPRYVFPQVDTPGVITVLRRLNLAILKEGTIHIGVFPSAHVSSAFAAAWGMFLVLPRRKVFGWTLLVYAVSVSLSTIYGRYHYAADVAAGFGVSLVSAAAALLSNRASRNGFGTAEASVDSAVPQTIAQPE